MTGDEPTLAELRRRVEDTRLEMGSSFKALNDRLDKLPTGNELNLQFKAMQTMHDSVVRDVKRLEAASTKRMDDLEQDQESFAAKLEANRKWSIGIALTVAGVLIGLGGFIFSVVGQ